MWCCQCNVIGLFRFVANKQFGQLITISSHLLTMLKTTNTEFSFIELCFTDQNNRPLEIEDNVKWLWSFGLGNISDVFNSTMREKKTLNDT